MMMMMKRRTPYSKLNLGQLRGHVHHLNLAPGLDQGPSQGHGQLQGHVLDPVLAPNLVRNPELQPKCHHFPDLGQDLDQYHVPNQGHVPNRNRFQDLDHAASQQHPDPDPVQALGVQGRGHKARHLCHAVDLGLAVIHRSLIKARY